MSLVACPKCGEFIQSTDDVCPKCNCNIRHWNLSGFYFSPEFHAPFKCDNEDYDGEYFLHVIPQSDSSGQLYFLSGKSKDDWRNERPVNYSYIGDEIRTEGKYYDKKIYHDQILYDEEYIYEGYIPEIQYFDVTCFDKTHEFHFRNDGLVEVTLISQKDSSKKRIGVGPYLRYKEFIITCYADCRWNEFVDRIFVVINHQIHLLAYVKEDKCKEVRDYANSLKERFHNIVLEIPQIDSPLNGFYRYIPSFLNGISGAYLSLISRGINRGIVYRVHKTNAGDFDDGLMDFTTRKNLELGKRWRDEYEDYYRVEGANVLVSLEPGGEPYYKLEIYTPDILLTEANLDFEGYIPDGERFCANCNINDGTFHWKLSFADDGTVVISDKRETVSGYYFVFEEIPEL